jgi:hypothetical protein
MIKAYRSCKFLASISLACVIGLQSISAHAQSTLYAIDNTLAFLSIVDPLTGDELSFVSIVVPNETYASGNGLATNPLTGDLYAAVKFSGQSGPGRNLILINPNTGAATSIGNMEQPIASLAFSSSGTLYGVTGDCLNGCGGVAIGETLFIINTSTAALTQVQTLGNGTDGEAIAFNPTDGMMYHMSGKGAGLIFEKINLGNGAVTSISLSGASVANREAIGFTYDAAQAHFVGSLVDWDSGDAVFFTINDTGFISDIAPLVAPWKDYAFATALVEPQTEILFGIDSVAAGYSAIDSISGSELVFQPILLEGEIVTRSVGMAVHPTTFEMYVSVGLDGAPSTARNLLQLNPDTGQARNVGTLDQRIASLAFNSSGTLYGVSGECNNGCDGSSMAETLFEISTTDASLTLVQALGNGDSGEAIAFNPDDGMMYHMSGQGTGLIFEKINLSNGAVMAIGLSGGALQNRQTAGFTYDAARGVFVGSLIDRDLGEGDFILVSPTGLVTIVGALDFAWKDFAFWDFENASATDIDNDGVPDVNDAFPTDPLETTDTDSDGIGNNADLDDDNDTMPDDYETVNGLNPLDATDAAGDLDGDGFTNLAEFEAGSNPQDASDFPAARKVPVAILLLLSEDDD